MNSNILTSKLNEFCFKLFTSLSKSKNENFFISPLSISTALTMTFTGSDTETADQLKSLLCLNDLTKQQILELNCEYLTALDKGLGEGVDLKLANKIFQNKNFKIHEQFTTNLHAYFQAETQALNFNELEESANHINSWVAEKTEQKIQNLLSKNALDQLTMMVLVNAIYFKGNWKMQFQVKNTQKEDFFLKDGTTTVKADMMKLLDKKFYHKVNPAGLKACTVEFPYTGEMF